MDSIAEPSPPEDEIRTIADVPDLAIRVIEPRDPDDEINPRQTVVFNVSRSALEPIRYFKTMLHGKFKESRDSTITLDGDDSLAMHVWFDLVHHGTSHVDHQRVTIATVWEMLISADKYGFSPQTAAAKEWFVKWLGPFKSFEARFCAESESNEDILRCLREFLFPCFSFDHAGAFAAMTRRLVYQSSYHITEARPAAVIRARLGSADLNHLHLPHNVIQQFNAAKGRLRTILHSGLWKPIKDIVDSVLPVDNRERKLWNYTVSLMNTKAFPVEEFAHKNGMDELCRRLDNYSSRGPFDDRVDFAVAETRKYFHGLCLDCMNQSKLGDRDTDYWRHATLGGIWDRGCRIKHGEPTWYFSFMGRREKMVEWTRERRRQAREE